VTLVEHVLLYEFVTLRVGGKPQQDFVVQGDKHISI